MALLFSLAVLASLVIAGHQSDQSDKLGGPGVLGGVGGKHGGGAPPPFLQNVTQQGRRAYFAIVENQNLTVGQIESQTSRWAKTYGVATQYNQMVADLSAHGEEIKRNVTSIISNLSAAQDAMQKIMDNKKMTRQQQREAIDRLRPQYRQEISTLYFMTAPFRKGPGGPEGPEGRKYCGEQGQDQGRRQDEDQIGFGGNRKSHVDDSQDFK